MGASIGVAGVMAKEKAAVGVLGVKSPKEGAGTLISGAFAREDAKKLGIPPTLEGGGGVGNLAERTIAGGAARVCSIASCGGEKISTFATGAGLGAGEGSAAGTGAAAVLGLANEKGRLEIGISLASSGSTGWMGGALFGSYQQFQVQRRSFTSFAKLKSGGIEKTGAFLAASSSNLVSRFCAKFSPSMASSPSSSNAAENFFLLGRSM